MGLPPGTGPRSWVLALALSPDGERVYSAGADRRVRVLPTRPEPFVDAICGCSELSRRALTSKEWNEHLKDIRYEERQDACPSLP